MAVLLADRALSVAKRAHPYARDERGIPHASPAGVQPASDPIPGSAQDNGDGSWTLRVDAVVWPLRAGDRVTDDNDLSWTITGVPILHRVPGYDDVDFIAAVGTLDPPQVP